MSAVMVSMAVLIRNFGSGIHAGKKSHGVAFAKTPTIILKYPVFSIMVL